MAATLMAGTGMDATMSPEQVGKNIKRAREQTGLKLEAVARRIGLSKQSLSRIERGQQNLKLSEILALAAALRVSVEDFFVADMDSGEIRLDAPQAPDLVLSLMIDHLQDLTPHAKEELYYILAVYLEGRIAVDDHAALMALLERPRRGRLS